MLSSIVTRIALSALNPLMGDFGGCFRGCKNLSVSYHRERQILSMLTLSKNSNVAYYDFLFPGPDGISLAGKILLISFFGVGDSEMGNFSWFCRDLLVSVSVQVTEK